LQWVQTAAADPKLVVNKSITQLGLSLSPKTDLVHVGWDVQITKGEANTITLFNTTPATKFWVKNDMTKSKPSAMMSW